ncbi:SDR family oxidoreductase [Lachnobacterium bovis]|uniref:dTDP-4-dehydrorhamnose reductase n=1 Tax=Lachnobacterium bovis TaxID=140626 RepID=A0A1H9R4H3_9FIRM|nr:NAD(P)-dependent oxidoreductase [Lachnobacterium bovis]SER67600.1 dTDP-4-dehydrorhamnose reductase [Lachnobacterium bovis]
MSYCSKIWVVGANGRLGSALVERLKANTKYIVLVSDTDVPVEDREKVLSFADRNHPGIIINCAGLTDVNKCEEFPEEAYKVNALGARNLAIAARKVDAKMIQISTDDVYNGKDMTALCEFDTPEPITMYGKSKLAGEKLVSELTDKHVIVRSSWVYGVKKDFVKEILTKARNHENIMLPGNEFSSPTSADALAGFIEVLMNTSEYGIFHASCEGCCTRAEFAREILRQANITDVTVETTADSLKLRPNYTLLDNMMLRITNLYKMPEWKEALSEYLAKGKENSDAK